MAEKADYRWYMNMVHYYYLHRLSTKLLLKKIGIVIWCYYLQLY